MASRTATLRQEPQLPSKRAPSSLDLRCSTGLSRADNRRYARQRAHADQPQALSKDRRAVRKCSNGEHFEGEAADDTFGVCPSRSRDFRRFTCQAQGAPKRPTEEPACTQPSSGMPGRHRPMRRRDLRAAHLHQPVANVHPYSVDVDLIESPAMHYHVA